MIIAIFLIIFFGIGLIFFIAAVLPTIGNIVIALLKYVVAPFVVIFLLYEIFKS